MDQVVSQNAVVVPLTFPAVEELAANGGPSAMRKPVAALVDEAFAAGLEQGRREGAATAQESLRQALAETESRQELLASLTQAFGAQTRQSLALRAQDVLELALELTEALLGSRPDQGIERLAAELPEVLAQLDVTAEVEIRIHPHSGAYLSELLRSLPVALPAQIQVIEDERLAPAQAVVRFGATRVDLSPEAALRRLRETFEQLVQSK
ncbi:MAG: FliH/SctL family protein [Actinomycetota bacterium]|nr:FliH/SctL family protein [Actinomycetota bacterium]MDA8209443.1 FliH/SctL family protein [Actinomycetota bacterium]